MLQVIEGKGRVIAYASKNLLPHQKSVLEQEAGAIVWALQKFENYVFAKPIEIQTDHRPLVQLKPLAENC